MQVTAPPAWTGPSSDPNDEQFGDVVEPLARNASADTEGTTEYDAVLLGEPYDGAVISRRGAREAPDAVREALAGSKAHHFAHGRVAGVGDLGNLAFGDRDSTIDPDSAPVEAVQDAVAEVTRRLHAAPALPVFLGGDNSLTVPNVRPLLDEDVPGTAGSKTVGVVSFDAHLDCREPVDGASSGTPYRQLFDAGLDGLAVVGARHFETSGSYADYLGERGGSIHPPETVRADPTGVVADAVEALGTDAVYVSLDVDVLDDAAAPGVSAPTPGGLAPADLYAALGAVGGVVAEADATLAGFEVVECSPPLDRDGRTVRAASRAVAHLLAGAVGADAPGVPIHGGANQDVSDSEGNQEVSGDA
jgi:formimidoylglutamase